MTQTLVAPRRGGLSTSFGEVMAGTWRRSHEDPPGPFRFQAKVVLPRLLTPFRTVTGHLSGEVHAPGLSEGGSLTGTIEISILPDRRIRYTFAFVGDDGRTYLADGWKSLEPRHVLRSFSTLPLTVTDEAGTVVGTADTRFRWRTLPSFLGSVRIVRPELDLDARRWHGRHPRLEVWYQTVTDPTTGTGLWFHHELRSTAVGRAEAHGWVGVFPPDSSPMVERFGPDPVDASTASPWFESREVVSAPGHLRGTTGDVSWDLTYDDPAAPLHTFPTWSWRREVLPATQVVTAPTARFSGWVTWSEGRLDLTDARGAAARIYGHANAQRWGWLHADLGDGDVLEVVAAVGRRPGLRLLPPLVFLRLRHGDLDWPSTPGLPRFRAELGLPNWRVRGRVGNRRLTVRVTQQPERCVRMLYRDPDGAGATCTNTERADAEILLEERMAGRWRTEARWTLDGTAHAEIGHRP